MSTVTERHIKEIVKLVDSSDQAARSNAIDVCINVYKFVGENFWNTYKEVLNQKSIDMIKSRLKSLGMLVSEEPPKKAEIRKAMTSPGRNSTVKPKPAGEKTPLRPSHTQQQISQDDHNPLPSIPKTLPKVVPENIPPPKQIIDMEVPDDRPNIDQNPEQEQDSNLDKIGKSIKQLKYGELSAQVDALVILNEVITSSLEEH